MHTCPTQKSPLQYSKTYYPLLPTITPPPCPWRTCHHPQQVHLWAAAQHEAEAQQHPGQVGRSEGEDTQEAECDVGVPPAPHIHHHERQAAAKELNGRKGGHQRQQGAAKQQHPQEICTAVAEGPCSSSDMNNELDVARRKSNQAEQVSGVLTNLHTGPCRPEPVSGMLPGRTDVLPGHLT